MGVIALRRPQRGLDAPVFEVGAGQVGRQPPACGGAFGRAGGERHVVQPVALLQPYERIPPVVVLVAFRREHAAGKFLKRLHAVVADRDHHALFGPALGAHARVVAGVEDEHAPALFDCGTGVDAQVLLVVAARLDHQPAVLKVDKVSRGDAKPRDPIKVSTGGADVAQVEQLKRAVMIERDEVAGPADRGLVEHMLHGV